MTSHTFRALLSGATGVGALKAASLLLTTIGAVVVARVLGPGGYGQVAFVLSVLSLIVIPSANALSPLVIREVANGRETADWPLLRGFLQWSVRNATLLALLLVVPVLVWSVLRLLGGADDDLPVLVLIASPAILFWTWGAFVSGTLQGLKKVVLAQVFDWLLNPVVYLCLVFLLLGIGKLTPATVLGSATAALGVSVACGLLLLRRLVPAELTGVESSQIPDAWLSAWRYFVIIQAVSVLNLKVPVVLLGTLGSDVQTGLYRASENVASLLSVSLLVANAVIAPYIAELFAKKDMGQLERMMRGAAKAALFLSLPLAIVVLIYGDWLLEWLFGGSYASAYSALVVLLIAQLINVACGSAGLLLNMTGHEQYLRRPLIIALVTNILLCLALVPFLGALGAAIAASASTVTWNLLSLMRARQLVGVNTAVV